MKRASDDLRAWRLFVNAASGKTFAEAAAAEGMDLAGASRALAKLESEAGFLLFDRTHRPTVRTAAAESLLPAAKTLLAAAGRLEEKAAALRERSKRRVYRLGMPASFSGAAIAGELEAFAAEAPGTTFETYAFRDEEDLIDGSVDAVYLPYEPAVREDSPFEVLPVFVSGTFLLASPGYLAEHGEPRAPEDLAGRRLFRRVGRRYPAVRRLYSMTESLDLLSGRIERIERIEPLDSARACAEKEALQTHGDSDPTDAWTSLAGLDPLSCLQAAAQGCGIAIDIPLRLAEGLLLDGRLVPLLPDWRPPLWHNALAVRRTLCADAVFMRFARRFIAAEAEEGTARWLRWCAKLGADGEAILRRGF